MTDLNALLNAQHRLQFGLECVDKQDLATGIALFDSVLDVEPDNLHALCNGAFLLQKLKRFDEARLRVDRALMIDARNGHAWSIKAMILQEMSRWAEADAAFQKAISYDPANQAIQSNYAYFLQLLGDYERAMDVYTKARDLNPLDLNTRFYRSMAMLTVAETQEQFTEAFLEYECRHFLYRTEMGGMSMPMWTGTEQTLDKTLVIVAEQGIGDAIWLGRYVRFLRERRMFEKIYMLCRQPLVGIMGRLHGDVDGIFTQSSQLPSYDLWVNSMSLLKVTGFPTIQASKAPYLKRIEALDMVDPIRNTGNVKIGLCWFGNPAHGNDRFRSIPIGKFEGVMAGGVTSNADFYSLQDHSDGTAYLNPNILACDVSSLDLLQERIQQMDLVVTVDTAQAHIAGALGVETYLLTSRGVDWRWGKTGSRVSLWYPGMRMFRSDMPLDWGATIAQVNAEIKLFVERKA